MKSSWFKLILIIISFNFTQTKFNVCQNIVLSQLEESESDFSLDLGWTVCATYLYVNDPRLKDENPQDNWT